MTFSQSLVQAANAWVGRMFRAGEPAQCAVFVRQVFHEVGVDLPVSDNPTDGLWTGEALANSFAGDNVGVRVQKRDLRPGDIVMFANTYGAFEPGTITHVGIYVGDSQMVDRPTSSAPVARRSIDVFQFAEGRRPAQLDLRLFKAYAHDDKQQIVIDGQTLPARFIRVNGRLVDTVEIVIGY